tara:strand:+ start:1392 stop:1925 length:534 start_codon:yes stop_codon:yes gene_type:complete
MKTNATHRAWYGRYLYKIRVKHDGKNTRNIRCWLNNSGCDWKKRKYNTNVMFFIFEGDSFQELCKQFSTDILETWQPLNQQARDAMLANVDVEIRKSLIHGKFRYRVSWPGVWGGRNVHCKAFVDQHLQGTETWGWYEGWQEYLYLQDKHQVMMLKLSVDTDHYIKILHVVLETELV